MKHVFQKGWRYARKEHYRGGGKPFTTIYFDVPCTNTKSGEVFMKVFRARTLNEPRWHNGIQLYLIRFTSAHGSFAWTSDIHFLRNEFFTDDNELVADLDTEKFLKETTKEHGISLDV